MPDIANRRDREQQVETLLRRAIGRTRQDILSALGSPPNVANVPDSLWQQLHADVEDDTRRVIAIMMLLAIRRMNDDKSIPFILPPSVAAERAAAFANARAATLADSITSTFQDRLHTVTNAGGTAADMRKAMREIREEQAKRGGITETTTANSAGELAYADEHEAETGVKLTATWNTERDGHVCEICAPLDGADDEDWRDDFPDGPPAHPSCRCWLEFEPAEVLKGV